VLVELSAGDDRCAVDLADGARLVSLVAGGAERLVAAPGARADLGYGCFPMAPWVGRLDGGRLPLGDGVHRLPPTPDEEPHALHGVVFERSWTRVSGDATSVRARCELASPWPLAGRVEQAVSLSPGGVDVELTVTAEADGFPAALGWHPWFAVGDADAVIGLEATGVLAVRDDGIPTGEAAGLDDRTDLRSPAAVAGRGLDHTYVGIGQDASVRWADLELVVGWGPTVRCVQVHTRALGVCVEPMTAWPDAVNLAARGVPGTGLVVLAAGASLTATMTWRWNPLR
jgi:aldose 1-epimerase